MGAIVMVTEIDPICALQAWWEICQLLDFQKCWFSCR